MKFGNKRIFCTFIAAVIMILTLSVNVFAEKSDFTLDKNSCSVTSGKRTSVAVSGTGEIKAVSLNKYVAEANYDLSSGKIIIKGNDYGTVKIKVYSSSDKSNIQYITVNVKIPTISGNWEKNGDFDMFKTDGGEYASGWNIIDGKTYYFYPNGVLNNDKEIVYGGKLYTISKSGKITKVKDKYHVFNVCSRTEAMPSAAEKIEDKILKTYGKDYCNTVWDKKTETLTFDTLYPLPSTYYFESCGIVCKSDKDLSDSDKFDAADFKFAKELLITVNTSDFSEQEKSFYEKETILEALSKCYGKAYKSCTDKSDADSAYYWSGVGAEKATVSIYFYSTGKIVINIKSDKK